MRNQSSNPIETDTIRMVLHFLQKSALVWIRFRSNPPGTHDNIVNWAIYWRKTIHRRFNYNGVLCPWGQCAKPEEKFIVIKINHAKLLFPSCYIEPDRIDMAWYTYYLIFWPSCLGKIISPNRFSTTDCHFAEN